MRAAKWHNEIEIFRQIKPCIILEGNILDQFQYPTEPFRNRHLPEYLYKLLKDLGYNVVVIYDESKGFYAVSGGQKDLVAFADLLQDVPGFRLTNDMIRCPFSAQGSCYTPSNPESADSARNKNDGQLLDSVCPAAATIGEAVTNALRQSDVSVAIIMDMASRYIVSPDQMDLLDVRVYTELQRALRCAEEADTNGSLSKNLLIFLTNKVNDLPTWFYLNNPDVKAISITTPDAQARLEFVSSNQLSQFFQRDIYAEDMRFYTDNPSQLDKLQKKFVGLTEGFSYSDLIGMRTLCYREHYRMSHLANVVDLYRYGIKENKWATVDRNTIDQLQKDMYANILGQNSALAKVMDVIKRSVVGRGGVSNNRPKGVLFFAGPTGTGKTETIKQIAKRLNIPYTIEDATKYTQEGYYGADVNEMILNLLKNSNMDIKKAQNGIIVIDEIDKKAGHEVSHDVAGTEVLKSLLKIIEGTTIKVPVEMDYYNVKLADFDTKNIIIIFLGAFSGLDIIRDKRLNSNPLGFSIKEETHKSKAKFLKQDLVKYGLPEEFVGRIDTIVEMNELTKKDLALILKKSELSIFKRYQNELSNMGITLIYNDDLFESIAEKSLVLDTGARELSNTVNYMFENIVFDVLSNPNKYKKCILDTEIAQNNTKYTLS